MDDSQMIVVNGAQGNTGDENLFVKFYMGKVRSGFLSDKEGRPIDVPKLFVSIFPPGNGNLRMERPANEQDKARFPKQWANYQNNKEQSATGTPIEAWPALDSAQVDELKYLKFVTVEQIAAATDAQMDKLAGLGQQLRQKAKAFLAVAKDTAAAQKFVAENEVLRNDNKALQDQVEALAARLDLIEKGAGVVEKRGPGRPRKVAAG